MRKLTKSAARSVLKELRKPEPNLQNIESDLLEYVFQDISGIQGPTFPYVKVSYGNVLAEELNLIGLELIDESEVYYYDIPDLIKIFEGLS